MSAPDRLARVEGALRQIMNARDQGAEGEPMPFGPDQAFDDWAADLASQALGASCAWPGLLGEAYQALYAVQVATGRTITELVGDGEVYADATDQDRERLADLLDRLQRTVER